MHKSLSTALLFLLIGAFAWAAPAWRTFTPPKERFQVQLPAGEVTDQSNPQSRQWMLVARGKYFFLVGYAKQDNSPAATAKFTKELVAGAHITQTGTKTFSLNGVKGTEVAGKIAISKTKAMPTRLRVFSNKDRIYWLNATVLLPTDQVMVDQFFQSFKFK